MLTEAKKNKIAKFAKEQLNLWGLSEWGIEWTYAQYAGRCVWSKRIIRLSKHWAYAHPIDECRDTVLHEIAHALAGKKGDYRHGRVWREYCDLVGARPEPRFESTQEENEKFHESYKRQKAGADPKVAKYTLTCPICGHQTGYSRKLKYDRSCGQCNPDFYDERYKMTIVQNY